jgi:hypothetical protein
MDYRIRLFLRLLDYVDASGSYMRKAAALALGRSSGA